MTKVHTVHPSIYTFKASYFWANINFPVYSHVLKCRPPQAGMKEFNHKHKWKSPFLVKTKFNGGGRCLSTKAVKSRL